MGIAGGSFIVTGGAQGIGKGIVRHLLERGAHVTLVDVDREAGEETRREYDPLGPVTFFTADCGDEEQVRAAVAYAVGLSGSLVGLVNNAGIADPGATPIEELSLEAWERVLRTNLTGYFLFAKHAAPHLRRSRGAIVNIASTRARQSEPHTEAYSASKGGVVALTHALAVSLGPDVRVNCVSPGWIDVSAWQKAAERRPAALRPIDHGQHPAGRVGTPGDVATLVTYLLSAAAGFITGQEFVVDGGMTRKMIYAG